MSRKAKKPATPREWVRGGAFPWPAPDALEDGRRVAACYAVTAVDAVRPAGADPVYRLSLSEARGSLEAWAPERLVSGAAEWLRPGTYVGVRGTVHAAGTGVVIQATSIGPVRVALDDLDLFLPGSPRDPEAMERELSEFVASVEDRPLAHLLALLLGPDSEIGQGFRLAPAATRHHHAYLRGLLEHTLAVAGLCDAIAGRSEPPVDRDLLVAAALLHDIGKVGEIGARAGFPYTEEGRLLGHILIGLRMVGNAARAVPGLASDRLRLLEHMIAAHQGRYEWQSPREPRTPEALILHYADDLDAKLARYRAGSHGRRDSGDPRSGNSGRPDSGTGEGVNGSPNGRARGPIRDDDTLDMFA
jgi:3'-5' exoribonuclease